MRWTPSPAGTRFRRSGVAALIILLMAVLAAAQESPVAAAARAARERKANNPDAKVVSNEQIPSAESPLTDDKREFLEQLKTEKDPRAEGAAQVLAINMGEAYEKASLEYFTLAKKMCAAGGGHIPQYKPADSEPARQWEALRNAQQAFDAEITRAFEAAIKNPARAASDLEKKKYEELEIAVPHWRDPAYLKSNPDQQRRIQEIIARYDREEKAAGRQDVQVKMRGIRIMLDRQRIYMPCGPTAL